MVRSTRRDFLKKSVAASAVFSTFTIAGTKSSGRVLGANDVVRVGIAGLNGRGKSHIGEFGGEKGREKGTQITYLIDPDSRLFSRWVKSIKSSDGNTPSTTQDIRQALDDDNLDVITVATPNHWHSLITIWACAAGKDVYVEKPCSHNVHEGRIALEAARKHNRIVQHGTQSRSTRGWAQTIAAVHSGKYGRLLISRGFASKPRRSIGFKPNTAPPSELDYNLWLGPASERPYHENLVHYNWHWNWDFGNGEIGNQGVHQMDIARWGIAGATLPKSVISLGGRFGYDDQGETPNTQVAIYDFGDTKLIFEVRGLVDRPTQKIDNEFYLEDGAIIDGRFYPKGSDNGERLGNFPVSVHTDGHFANFISAVRSRRQDELAADIREGHYSSALCHLGNISYRLGSPVMFDAKNKTIGDDKMIYEELASMKEHLKERGVSLTGESCQLGRRINVDPERETIVGDDDAAQMLTRNYRDGFAVPQSIA